MDVKIIKPKKINLVYIRQFRAIKIKSKIQLTYKLIVKKIT